MMYFTLNSAVLYIRLSENVFFTTLHLRRNAKPSLRNVALFISTEQNGSYVIRQNNIKQKNVMRLLFSHKTKETFRTT